MQEWQSTNHPVGITMAPHLVEQVAMIFLLNIGVRSDATLDESICRPTQLHDIVSALPLFLWMTLAVHALADRPLCEDTSLAHTVEASA
jgi:hypothetical protein